VEEGLRLVNGGEPRWATGRLEGPGFDRLLKTPVLYQGATLEAAEKLASATAL
jgi:hypothetical protein